MKLTDSKIIDAISNNGIIQRAFWREEQDEPSRIYYRARYDGLADSTREDEEGGNMWTPSPDDLRANDWEIVM
jgi:hypothetical protein